MRSNDKCMVNKIFYPKNERNEIAAYRKSIKT